MRFAVVAHEAGGTSAVLAAQRLEGVESAVLSPAQAIAQLGRGDTVLARLDVLKTVDGIEPGVWALDELEETGVRVLNRSSTLRACHDKLITARVLAETGLPHPQTHHIWEGGPVPDIELPVVVKPRFGSWGREVVLCETLGSLAKTLESLRRKLWYVATGALLQELVPPTGYDLRIVVAAGRMVGAISRVAQPGEWRTNVALGAWRRQLKPPRAACELALAAARAVRGDLVGVDLLPAGDGYVVLEVNGAVEFTPEYALGPADVHARAVSLLTGRRVLTSLAEVI
jgi:ribosomal protein S6--L-glutamate ligase